MKRTLVLSLLALGACTPAPAPEPAATVERLYKTISESKGETSTDIAQIPLTEEVALMLQEVESTADGPVIDGDIAANCQDCTGFSDLKVGAPQSPLPETPGHTMVEARFKLFGDVQRAILWDMVKVGDAWKVDNIESEGFNLRAILDEHLGAQAAGRAEDAQGAIQCMTFIQLEREAVLKAKPPGDVTALDAAFASWKARADTSYTPEELAHTLVRNRDEMDDMSPADIKIQADDCVTISDQTDL